MGEVCSPLGPALAGAGAAEAIEPGAGFLGLCQPACTGSTREASVGLTDLVFPAVGVTLGGLFGAAVAVAFPVLELLVLGAVDAVSISILMARACLNCSSLKTMKHRLLSSFSNLWFTKILSLTSSPLL